MAASALCRPEPAAPWPCAMRLKKKLPAATSHEVGAIQLHTQASRSKSLIAVGQQQALGQVRRTQDQLRGPRPVWPCADLVNCICRTALARTTCSPGRQYGTAMTTLLRGS